MRIFYLSLQKLLASQNLHTQKKNFLIRLCQGRGNKTFFSAWIYFNLYLVRQKSLPFFAVVVGGILCSPLCWENKTTHYIFFLLLFAKG